MSQNSCNSNRNTVFLFQLFKLLVDGSIGNESRIVAVPARPYLCKDKRDIFAAGPLEKEPTQVHNLIKSILKTFTFIVY